MVVLPSSEEVKMPVPPARLPLLLRLMEFPSPKVERLISVPNGIAKRLVDVLQVIETPAGGGATIGPCNGNLIQEAAELGCEGSRWTTKAAAKTHARIA